LIFLQQAQGGNGHGGLAGEDPNGLDGRAGDGFSSLTTTNPGGGSLDGTTVGRGGNTLLAGQAGGNGTALIDLNGNVVTTLAQAFGGTGGSDGMGHDLGGDAIGTSSATGSVAANVYSQAFVQGHFGTAVARSTGSAPSGGVQANAGSSGGIINNVRSVVTSSLGGAQAAEARSAVAAAAPAFSLTNGLQGVAYATALPSNADAAQAVTGNPNATAAFDVGGASTILGLVRLGGSGAAQNFFTEVNFNCNTGAFANQALKLGLVNPQVTSNGFAQITFQVSKNNNLVVNQSFMTLAAAVAYFNDHVLTLGTAGSLGSGDLILRVFGQRNAGDGFHTEILIGTAPISPLSLITAVSRKIHSLAGTFDINLPTTSTVGVESRSGGANGDHTLVVFFNNDIASGAAQVTLGTGSVVAAPSIADNTMTISLTGVTDIQTLSVTLSNLTDVFAQNLADSVVPVAFLVGDANANRTVNASDINLTKGQAGAPLTGANFRADVNASGSVSASDIGQVKASAGHVLPP
jgi:hypothetical protein